MAIEIFLDTNVIVDYFDAKRSGYMDSRQIITEIENGNLTGCISESVINTSVYLLRKSFSLIDLKNYIGELVAMLKVLPCRNSTIKQAYLLETPDLEDAVLYQLAFENNLNYFVTSDKKDFKKLSSVLLPVVTGKELLKLIS